MDKITLKLMKYFILIIALIIAICLLASSIFLSKYSLEQQYNKLETSAKGIYTSLNNSEEITDTSISAILINNNETTLLTQGKMGMMSFFHNITNDNINTKGILKNGMGIEFLYYKLETNLGDIVVFDNNEYSSDYLKVVYIVLFFIFISSLILSLPLISFIGKKLTQPILKLQKVASSISKGNFDVDCTIKTNDEIETLANSLMMMSADLKRKYQLQRDFVANVSHDFKTPLSVIRNYSEAINDGLLDEEGTKKYSREIIKEVDRLNTLVMDVLQLSKLQDGVYSLKKEYISLNDLVDDCIKKFHPLVNKKNISITSHIEPIFIYADYIYIQRVLYNFIDNAIKFSLEKGTIEIFTTSENNSIKLSVRDNGIGIENSLIEEIWDKYYKISQSGGMGLGLPICSEILKKHEFEYGVTSSADNGTEFYFIISNENIKRET